MSALLRGNVSSLRRLSGAVALLPALFPSLLTGCEVAAPAPAAIASRVGAVTSTNGLALNGLALNGLALNGLALNGLALNGLALNGLALNGLALNGVPLTEQPAQLASFKVVLRYLVECALPNGRSVTFSDENQQPLTLSGALGFAPEWESGTLSLRGQRRVSACLAARVNAQGKTVRLSLRAEEMAPTTPVERATYRYHEGAFWGNLFGSTPYVRTCAVQGSTLVGRECTAQGGCGFQVQGSCASICATHDSIDGSYTDCQGPDDAAPEHDVVNAFLPIQSSVLSSFNHSCAVSEDGSLRCWGKNDAGQLGDGTTTDNLSPVVVAVPAVASVAAGRTHTCALATDSSVWCWGDNASGQLGDGTTSSHRTPAIGAVGVVGAVAVMAGDSHSCALTSEGSVWCWGDNSFGQLGDGTTSNRPAPVRVGISDVVRLALGHRHTCALTSEGSVWCWGKNDAGQLGDGTTTTRSVPVRALSADATSVAAGKSHTCALKSDRSVWCWGGNALGQLGDGSNANRLSPVPTASHSYKAAAVAVGADSSCSVQTDGKLYCWGSQDCLGAGSAAAAPPKKISGLDKLGRRLVLGRQNAFVQDSDGRWLAWGCNQSGELGTGTTTRSDDEPVAVAHQTCGNSSQEPPRETASSCGYDFCQRCEVKESTHGSAACGACGEKLTLARDEGSSCDGKPTYLVTDCETCGVSSSGPNPTCNTCSVCVAARSCQSCTVASCTLCGSR